MKAKKAIIITAIIAFVVAATIIAPRLMNHQAAGGVRVAINAPLTGPIAAWSGQFHNGFAMGIADASKTHGLDPALFSLDIQDNAGKPEQAVSILRKQEIGNPNVYVTVAAGPVNAVAPQLDSSGKPQFLASFDPNITRSSENRFRIMANSRIEAPLFIEYAKARKAKKIHVIYLNYSNLEEQFTQLLEPQLKDMGISVSRERYDMDVRDFRTIVEKAKLQSPDLIFVMGFSFHLQALIRDLRVAGMTSNGRVIANMDFVDLVYTAMDKKELEDIVFISPLFDIEGKVPRAENWRQDFEKRFGTKPTYVPAYAYDNATLLVNTFAKHGSITPQALMDSVPFEGINGTIALDANRDIIATVALAQLDADGRIIELKK